MTDITPRDIVRLLTETAGDIAFAGSADEALDLTFEELGCDSLALLETTARIKQDYGVDLPDDAITKLGTPRALLENILEHLNGTAAQAG